jgi:hypothetical protein
VGKGASTASGSGRVIDELALPLLVAIVVETEAALSLSSEADWAGLTVKIQMIIKK